jgi:hypothetical protein
MWHDHAPGPFVTTDVLSLNTFGRPSIVAMVPAATGALALTVLYVLERVALRGGERAAGMAGAGRGTS